MASVWSSVFGLRRKYIGVIIKEFQPQVNLLRRRKEEIHMRLCQEEVALPYGTSIRNKANL